MSAPDTRSISRVDPGETAPVAAFQTGSALFSTLQEFPMMIMMYDKV